MESSRSGKPEDIQSSAHEEKKTEQVESIPPVAEEELSEADRLLWEKLFNDSISAELFAHRDIILSNFSETARDKAFHETEEILNKFIVKLIRIRKEAAGKDKETQEAVALCKKASAFLEKV